MVCLSNLSKAPLVDVFLVHSKSRSRKNAIDLDELNDDSEEDKEDNDRGSQASEEQEEDYDVDEEYDNDYAENYFDNGEGDDYDNLGDGGGDEGGGGELVRLCVVVRAHTLSQAWTMTRSNNLTMIQKCESVHCITPSHVPCLFRSRGLVCSLLISFLRERPIFWPVAL
jgi:hypothetical protein